MGYYSQIKYIESIMFSSDIEEKLETTILDINFLIYLERYLNLNKSEHFMDEQMKERIYYIIKRIRESLKDRKLTEKETELINTIIRKTNATQRENALNFYCTQAINRSHNMDKTSINEIWDNFLYMLDEIRESISYDYEVLCYLNKATEDTTIIEKYKGDPWFLCSIKGMYAECSEIFENGEIKENLKQVLDENEKVFTKQMLKNSNSEIRKKIIER